MGYQAILLNLLSISILSGLFTIVAVSLFLWVSPSLVSQYSEASLRKILWIIVLSPWFIGFSTALIIMTSGTQYFPAFGIFDQLHWHHESEFSFSSWHGVFTLLATLSILTIVVKKIILLFKNINEVSTLNAVAEKDSDGFYYLETEAFTAFTAGYNDPKCYITSALKSELTGDELNILKHHENEHIRQRDPFKKWAFQLFASFFPKFASQILIRHMMLAIEQCADSAISSHVKDKALIAMTLLKVVRLTAKFNSTEMNKQSICYYARDSIEERIAFILANKKSEKMPFIFIIPVICALVGISAFSVDNFHHFIEFSLSH
jgi:Zn-dependent protease with chaperone function